MDLLYVVGAALAWGSFHAPGVHRLVDGLATAIRDRALRQRDASGEGLPLVGLPVLSAAQRRYVRRLLRAQAY